ncbi:DUF1593 domain-containing protein [Verrucomicrobiaceae bacterium 227]
MFLDKFITSPLLAICLVAFTSEVSAREKPRIIVSTDIGGDDPDDFQSMIHYLVYADVFENEGLISSPPGKGREGDLLSCIASYEKDYANLSQSSADYPTPDSLRRVIKQGARDAQAEELPTQVSEGAKLIVARALDDDPRPLYVLVWGSITDVAQAVHHSPEIKAKLRIYSIGSWNTSQDPKARNYLFHKHPDLWWIENDSTFRGMYMGGEQKGDFGNLGFTGKHVKGHGHLGALFMEKKADIKMGDSPSVLYFLHGDIENPEGEHWGGDFVRPAPEKRPTYWHDDPDKSLSDRGMNGAKTVNQWRKDFLLDWQARMDRLLPQVEETTK